MQHYPSSVINDPGLVLNGEPTDGERSVELN